MNGMSAPGQYPYWPHGGDVFLYITQYFSITHSNSTLSTEQNLSQSVRLTLYFCVHIMHTES